MPDYTLNSAILILVFYSRGLVPGYGVSVCGVLGGVANVGVESVLY